MLLLLSQLERENEPPFCRVEGLMLFRWKSIVYRCLTARINIEILQSNTQKCNHGPQKVDGENGGEEGGWRGLGLRMPACPWYTPMCNL